MKITKVLHQGRAWGVARARRHPHRSIETRQKNETREIRRPRTGASIIGRFVGAVAAALLALTPPVTSRGVALEKAGFEEPTSAGETGPMPQYLRGLQSAPEDSVAGRQRLFLRSFEAVVDAHVQKLEGAHLNLAAATDVPDGTGARPAVVQNRSWSTDPLEVSALHDVELSVHSRRGLLLASKHFPGLGGAFGDDGHFSAPVIDKTLEEMERRELIPFRWAIQRGARLIMTGHGIYPRLSPNEPTTPASMSKEIVTGLLREKLGFEGLVITDELMTMDSVSRYEPDLAKRVGKAILAGNDIALLFVPPNDQDARMASLLSSLSSMAGRDPELNRRITESARRVLLEKQRVFGESLFAWFAAQGLPVRDVDAILSALTLEERIGQLIMHDAASFSTNHPRKKSTASVSITRKYGLGGQYARRALAPVVEGVKAERTSFKIPPFIGVESEADFGQTRGGLGWDYHTGYNIFAKRR